MWRERRVFRIQVQDKWVSAWLYSFLLYSKPRQYEKRGWHIMRRLIVLCAIFLSVLSFPGNVCALQIQGAVWSTDAYKFALDPSLGPPQGDPDAYFVVNAINFDSLSFDKPKDITFDEFLNFPIEWKILNTKFSPKDKMFTGTSKEEGIFFQFTWSLVLPKGPLPVTVIHDDGFYFSILNIFEFGPETSKPVTGPEPIVTTFSVKGLDQGIYTATLNYGALNDSANHVLIYNTPEPWTILLLGLGMLGLGILRRKI
jgi:hypothetical protein